MTDFRRNVQVALSLAVFFAVIAIAAGIAKAVATTASLVVAYFLEFYVLRLIVYLVLSRKVAVASVLIGAAAIVVGALLVYLNYGVILSMALVCVFVLDALILRFGVVRKGA